MMGGGVDGWIGKVMGGGGGGYGWIGKVMGGGLMDG